MVDKNRNQWSISPEYAGKEDRCGAWGQRILRIGPIYSDVIILDWSGTFFKGEIGKGLASFFGKLRHSGIKRVPKTSILVYATEHRTGIFLEMRWSRQKNFIQRKDIPIH